MARLVYADDSELVSTNAEDIQEIVTSFATSSTSFGLKINGPKTEFLHQPHPEDLTYWQDVLVNGSTLN